jgi:hypothetical protein
LQCLEETYFLGFENFRECAKAGAVPSESMMQKIEERTYFELEVLMQVTWDNTDPKHQL